MSISVKSQINGPSGNKFLPPKLPYDRLTQLPKLTGLWPNEIADETYEATARIVALLQKALRAERRRGHAGHWTYNLSRHAALAECLKEEKERLRQLTKQRKTQEIQLKKETKPHSPARRTGFTPIAQLSLNSLRQSRDVLPRL